VSPLHAQDAGIGLAPGARPPGPTLETVNGTTVDLAEVIGSRPIFLEFWATWCPLCRALEPRVLDAHRRFGDRVAFFGVAVAVQQSRQSVRRHLDSHPIPFPMLWDARGEAVRAFEAPSTSYVVILDADGAVVYTGTGSNQDLASALERAVDEEAEGG
jgi:thiol-disulfide isomerase/thioredoxin